jgi:phosphoenolpyruvate carboxylase
MQGGIMLTPEKDRAAYRNLVVVKYHLYNSLLLSQPFPGLEKIGAHLPVFSRMCRTELKKGATPTQLIQNFLQTVDASGNEEQAAEALFMVLRLVERQVVLFDALEEAAFAKVNDMHGMGTLAQVVDLVKDAGLEHKWEEKVKDYQNRIVLTAHPTQFYPVNLRRS